MRITILAAALLACCTAQAGLIVTDPAGNQLSTGMGWDIRTPRPTDADVLASSLAPTIERLRDRTCIRPRDIGDDAPDDDTELLRWSLLVSRVLDVPLWIDREYGYSDVLETQENQTIRGNGPYAPGLRMLPGEWFANPDFSWPKRGVAAIVHAPGVKWFTLRDLQLDGGQQDVDWHAVATGPHAARFSQFLRESPCWGGVCPTTQDGRSPLEELTLENVHIHDCPGSCLFGMAKVHARNLTLGNSVSGRILYRFRGECTGLHTYGFSRSSVARVNAQSTIAGWTYRGEGQVNPWPTNDQPDTIVAIERMSGVEGSVTLSGIDFDGADSVFLDTTAIRSNDDCRISGEVRNLRSFAASPVNLGPYTVALDLVCRDSRPPDLGWPLANVRDARLRYVNTTTRKSKADHDWSYTAAGYRDWSRAVPEGFKVSVARKPHHAPDHTQTIELHIDEDWPQWLVVHFVDLAIDGRLRRPDEVIPTTVRVSGRIDNRLANWIGTMPGVTQAVQFTPAELERLPVRVIVDGLACRKVEPGSFRGNQPWSVHRPLVDVGAWFPLP